MKFKDYINEVTINSINKPDNILVLEPADEPQKLEKLAKKVDKKAFFRRTDMRHPDAKHGILWFSNKAKKDKFVGMNRDIM